MTGSIFIHIGDSLVGDTTLLDTILCDEFLPDDSVKFARIRFWVEGSS